VGSSWDVSGGTPVECILGCGVFTSTVMHPTMFVTCCMYCAGTGHWR
jgi:hypothetical protein